MVSSRAALQLVQPLTPEERFTVWLSQLDDDMLSCRAERGGRHDMPRLRNLDGARVRRLRGGVYEIVAACKVCGLPGTLVTGKGGKLDGTETWQLLHARARAHFRDCARWTRDSRRLRRS